LLDLSDERRRLAVGRDEPESASVRRRDLGDGETVHEPAVRRFAGVEIAENRGLRVACPRERGDEEDDSADDPPHARHRRSPCTIAPLVREDRASSDR